MRMPDRSILQGYVNNFRRHIGRFLKPGIGIRCDIYPIDGSGAVIAFHFGAAEENDDTVHPSSVSFADALSKVPQRTFGGNLSGITFKGTNTILEPERAIFIKDDSAPQWRDSAAKNDVDRVVSGNRGGRS